MSATFETAVTYHLGLAAAEPGLTDSLTPVERLALDRIDPPACRQDWLAGIAAAKRAVSQATGESRLERIQIRARWNDGATAVVAEDDGTVWPSDVSVVVARRRGHGAAVAVRGPHRVGVHLECADAVRDEHAAYLLTVGERGALDRYGVAELWALKEAAWKALACDRTMVFDSLELVFDVQGAVGECRLFGQLVPVRATVWRPWPGYVLAIVTEADAGP